VGERIRIYVPKCHVRTMHNTNERVFVEMHPSYDQAKKACDECKQAIKDMCVLDDRTIASFVIEELDQ